jgi:hypothetical protein
MAEVQYKLKKGSLLGGAYGTDITVNYSHFNALKQNNVNDTLTSSKLYSTKYSEFGEDLYHDLFVEISRKFNKKWKATIMYCKQFNNVNIIQHNTPGGEYNNLMSHIGVIDVTHKYRSNAAIRFEAEILFRNNTDTLNLGSWAMGMIEWTPNTHVFLAVVDQYNYGNPVEDLKLHYFLVSAGYTSGPHRISLSYGKQRQGIFCVGGVCRQVPASNGVALSITSSF